jgi:hypothetical protein
VGRETHERGASFEEFAAELTEAAYPVALKHKAEEWLDLKLELWQAMVLTVQKWQQGAPAHPVPLFIPIQPETSRSHV